MVDVLLNIVYDCSVELKDLPEGTDLALKNVASDEIHSLLDCLNDLDINTNETSKDTIDITVDEKQLTAAQSSDSQHATVITPANQPLNGIPNSVNKHDITEDNAKVASTFKIIGMNQFLQADLLYENLTYDLPDSVMSQRFT